MAGSALALTDISHAIQLALAPAFLLTGIAGMLNVMTGRLARIIDRGRQLADLPDGSQATLSEATHVELTSLEQRRYLASSAITACTFSALLVCTVIATLFLQVLLGLDFAWALGVLFTASTLTLVVGLGYFLREVHLATRTVRIQSTLSR